MKQCLCACALLLFSIKISVANSVTDFMRALTTDEPSVLQKKIDEEKKASEDLYGITLYEPTYVLPLYYTARPYYSVYGGSSPEDQQVTHTKLKAQLSLAVPVFNFSKNTALKLSYTQMFYWQFYARSRYFRESSYKPQLFISSNPIKNWLIEAGVAHEPNGRGGDLERSWNRAFVDVSLSGEHWMLSVKPWILILKAASSDLRNKDIDKFLGYGRILAAYKTHDNTFSLMLRNNVTSGFRFGTVEATWSFPLKKYVKGYIQAFSGYGQSLIEYDHYTNSIGIGVILNDVI